MIAFDFDGVICDVHHIFRGHFFDKWGITINKEEDQDTFEFTPTDGKFPDKWWEEIPVAIARGAIWALDCIQCMSDEPIQIITAREPSQAVMRVTRDWCDKLFTFPYRIDFCATSEEKDDILDLMQIEYYVDDRYKTVNSLAKNINTCFLMERPWNRGRKLAGNVVEIKTLWEMRNGLEKLGIGVDDPE
jgi:hypothetical protein